MRFKQCYCILAFLLRGIDIDDCLAFDRIQPTIFQSTSLSPFRCESRVYSSNKSQTCAYFLSAVFLAALRILLICSCLPCLAAGCHAIPVSLERIVINMAASPLTNAVAVELLLIAIISVGIKCERASPNSVLGKGSVELLAIDQMSYHHTVD
jgi:hypothetical protein